MNEQILKVLVGSHAHGLATPDSDMDYRGVFVVPTADILKLGGSTKSTSWTEGDDEDNTSYEIGHFLHLATKSNPSILEVFTSPEVESTDLGYELRALFPKVWGTRRVIDAFGGYSLNQRKKFLDDKYDSHRKGKYAVAYIRVLLSGISLVTTGVLPSRVDDDMRPTLAAIKAGEFSTGEVINMAEGYKTALFNAGEQVYGTDLENVTDMDAINEFLLKVRGLYWR